MSSTDEFGNNLRDMSTSASEDWEDEETKFFVRSKLLTPNELDSNLEECKSHNFATEVDKWIDDLLSEDESFSNVRPTLLDVVKPLLGMTLIFLFYLILWLH
jgi:hypothetical protein